MNTAMSYTFFEDYNIPTKAASPFLEPIPKIEDLDEGIHVFPVLGRSYNMPVSVPIPEKYHPVLDVECMAVSSSLLRRIEYELTHGECDLRTVYSSCRGLARGSLEFEDAYIKARIRSFTRHQRIATDPLPGVPFNARNSILTPPLKTANQQTLAASHPMGVNHLGHLMQHFGIWVLGLLGIQVLGSWRIGAFANTYLEGGRFFYFSIALFLFLAIDSAIWFRRRGNLSDAFLVPGAVLYLIALMPILIIHMRQILQVM